MNQLDLPQGPTNDVEQPQNLVATISTPHMVDDVTILLWPQLLSSFENQVEQFLRNQLDRALRECLSSLAYQLITQFVQSDVLVESIANNISRQITHQEGTLDSPRAGSQCLPLDVHRSAHAKHQGVAIGVALCLGASTKGPLGSIPPGEERLLRQRGRARYKANGPHCIAYCHEFLEDDEDLPKRDVVYTETHRKRRRNQRQKSRTNDQKRHHSNSSPSLDSSDTDTNEADAWRFKPLVMTNKLLQKVLDLKMYCFMDCSMRYTSSVTKPYPGGRRECH